MCGTGGALSVHRPSKPGADCAEKQVKIPEIPALNGHPGQTAGVNYARKQKNESGTANNSSIEPRTLAPELGNDILVGRVCVREPIIATPAENGPLEARPPAELETALEEYAQLAEKALSSTERRLGEVTEAAAMLLKRIEIAQSCLEAMSWWDHLWTMLRRPPSAYRRWAEADHAVDEAFGMMEQVLNDSMAPGPGERRLIRGDIATAYGRLVGLLAAQRAAADAGRKSKAHSAFA